MKSNYKELLNQFIAAKGIKNIDQNSEMFMKEFSNWIENRKIIGANYLKNLSKLGLFINSWSCAEVNKGVEDSITLPFATKLLTPYIKPESIDYSKRVIDGNFYVDKKHKFSAINTKDILVEVISNKEIETYMTQNPYNSDMIDGWDLLHNSGRNNIVVGLYGNTSDKDRQEKIEMLQSFKKKLNNIREIDYVIGDEYYYVLGSPDSKLKK